MSWLDFKLGLRMLVRYPAMTVVGGLAMALGIAIGATLFQVVSELIFPDHPYADPSRIVGIQTIDTRTGDVTRRVLHDLGVWRSRLTTVEQVGGRQRIAANLDVGDGRPEPVEGIAISASAFVLAPTPPVLGRPILAADEAADAAPVAVLSHDLWQSRFGGDEGVVGRVVRLGGRVTTVVGVMPPGFVLHVPQNDLIYVGAQEVWTPFRLDPEEHAAGEGPLIAVFGRLADGVTASGAQAELSSLGAAMAADAPSTHAALSPRITTFSNPFGGLDRGVGTRGVMSMVAFFIAAVIVTLCANVALLLFARAATREHEIVVRGALGASRGRIVAQLFAEALGLATVALALGWLGASVGIRWIVDAATTIGFAEGVSQPPVDAALAPRTMAYAAGLAIGGAVVAGVLPGVKITGRRAGASPGSGRGSVAALGRTWGAIIVVQVALTTTLVPLAIVIGVQTLEMAGLDRGFPAQEYLSLRLEMDRELSADGAPVLDDSAFLARYEDRYQELARRIRAEPGVTGVAAGHLPGFDHELQTPELEPTGAGEAPTIGASVQVASVDPEFFDAMGMRLVSGRLFDARDRDEDARSVVVNESFVRDRLDGGNALGRRLRYVGPAEGGADLAADAEPWLEIVGVVSDVVMTVDPTLASAAGVYHPRAPAASHPLRVAIHVLGSPTAFAGRLRELAAETSPALRVRNVLTLDQAGAGTLAIYGLFLKIGLVIGGFTLLLTNAGIYAVTAFTVSRRTREIGVRVALGAERHDIVSATLSRTGRRVALGVVLGSVPGIWLTWGLAGGSMMPSAGMVATGVGYAMVMAAVCMAACIVPTRRALAIQPTEALATEG